MRPLRHTVRLVDARERYRRQTSQDAGRRATADTATSDQHLGRQQQEVDVTGRHRLHDGATLQRSHVGVDTRTTYTVR